MRYILSFLAVAVVFGFVCFSMPSKSTEGTPKTQTISDSAIVHLRFTKAVQHKLGAKGIEVSSECYDQITEVHFDAESGSFWVAYNGHDRLHYTVVALEGPKLIVQNGPNSFLIFILASDEAGNSIVIIGDKPYATVLSNDCNDGKSL